MIQLYKRSPDYVGGAPFQGDLFGRKQLAIRLTEYLGRLNEGCVIGITADWGDGKSWFGRNWHAMLGEKEFAFQTIFIDAFENDFVEDPFVLIASELVGAAGRVNNGDSKKKLVNGAAKVGKNIIPSVAKGAMTLASRILVGSEATEELKDLLKGLPEEIGDATEKHVRKRITEHDEYKKSIQSYKNLVAEFAASSSKPLVFFIDELDRCKPTFAVQLIERIKHFFDVPNLIFVLLLNREQLEAAIQGVYGANIKAGEYLGKFIHLFMTLPKSNPSSSTKFHEIYLRKLLERHDYPFTEHLQDFVYAMSILAEVYKLSFRDLERALILYGIGNFQASSHLAAYAIALKLKKPELLERYAKKERSAHEDAYQALASVSSIHKGFGGVLEPLMALHRLCVVGEANLEQQYRTHLNNLIYRGDPADFFRWLASRIDIQFAE